MTCWPKKDPKLIIKQQSDKRERAAALEAGLRELVEEMRQEAADHETRQESGGYPESAAQITRTVARTLRFTADRFAALLAEHGSDS